MMDQTNQDNWKKFKFYKRYSFQQVYGFWGMFKTSDTVRFTLIYDGDVDIIAVGGNRDWI